MYACWLHSCISMYALTCVCIYVCKKCCHLETTFQSDRLYVMYLCVCTHVCIYTYMYNKTLVTEELLQNPLDFTFFQDQSFKHSTFLHDPVNKNSPRRRTRQSESRKTAEVLRKIASTIVLLDSSEINQLIFIQRLDN